MLEAVPIAVMAGVIGAVAGSFCATAAVRFAANESPWGGRSRCDGCARVLGWSETVPFIGFVRSGGACAACHKRIDPLHMWGEALGALSTGTTLAIAPTPAGILMALTGLVLLAQALIDVRVLRLPNLGNGLVAGLCALLAWERHELVAGLVAAIASGLLLYGLKVWLERRRKQTMLGVGDIKLIAALALGLGLWTPYMLAGAAIAGMAAILIRRMAHQDRLPFGPFIAMFGFIFLCVANFAGVLP